MTSLGFPASIGPFTMSQARLTQAFNSFYQQHQFPKPDPTSDETSMAGISPYHAGLGQGDIIFCQLSPLHPITLDSETKAAAKIPQQATYFAWAYPIVNDGSVRLSGQSPETAFLEYGGYIYFNDARDAVGTNSICPAALGTLGLMFGRPQPLHQDIADTLTRQGRFQEITLAPLAQAGATHFGWIRPGEFSGKVASPDGCFAYKFGSGPAKYFPVVSKPVYTVELLKEELDTNEAWAVIRNRTPGIEVAMIFDKTQPLEENCQNNAHSVELEGSAVGATVSKDSDPSLKLSYEEWQRGKDQGTIAEPWIISPASCTRHAL